MLEKSKNWQDHLKPYARVRLNQFLNEIKRIRVFKGKGELFECFQAGCRNLLGYNIDYVCEYGIWQICKLPCKHVVVVILYEGGNLRII